MPGPQALCAYRSSSMPDRKPSYVAVPRDGRHGELRFSFGSNGTRKVRRCFPPAGNLPGRKIMARTVGAESGDQRQTVVILSDRSREIIRLFEELQRKRQQAEQSPGCGATKHAGAHAKLG